MTNEKLKQLSERLQSGGSLTREEQETLIKDLLRCNRLLLVVKRNGVDPDSLLRAEKQSRNHSAQTA